MSPVTHFLTGWVFANCARMNRPQRAIVTLASVAPDIDGLGIIPEILTRHSKHPLLWFSEFHHSLHTLLFAACVSACAFALANSRWKIAGLAFLSVHLHLLEDLVGSRGPDGFQWPIPYLKPFSSHLELTWSGQWMLNAWQNYVITILLIAITLWIVRVKNVSPVEIFSEKADKAVVDAICGKAERVA